MIKYLKYSVFVFYLFVISMCICDQCKCTSIMDCKLNNNIRIILKEDFKSPVVSISIIFGIGYIDENSDQRGIVNLITENIVSTSFAKSLLKYGITYSTDCSNINTFIRFHVPVKHMKKFFTMLVESILSFNVNNLDMFKQHLILSHEYAGVRSAVNDNLNGLIRDRKRSMSFVLNKTALNYITEKDVLDFYNDKYKKCPLTIVATGAVWQKQILKELQSTFSMLAVRNKIDHNTHVKKIRRHLILENKFINNTFYNIYRVSKKHIRNNVYAILWLYIHELENYFIYHQKISDFANVKYISYRGDGVLFSSIHTRSDISMQDVQESYNAFIRRFCSTDYSHQYLFKIAQDRDYINRVLSSDLDVAQNMIELVVNDDFKNIVNMFSITNIIKNMSDSDLQFICEEIFKKNHIIKVETINVSDK